MKPSKLVLFLLIAGIFTATTSGCKKCKDEDPRAKIINNGTTKADVQVKTSGGNTVNINNVLPGTSSEYSSYAPGVVIFTVTVGKGIYTEVIDASECYDYDIIIGPTNQTSVSESNRND